MSELNIPTTNFYEPSGAQFITVNRVDNLVQLVYLDQSFLTSQLVQSELDLSQPYCLTAPYSQAMFLSLTCLERYPKKLYLAGLGGGRIPFVLRYYLPELAIACTEIDPTIVEVAQSYFGVVPCPNLQVSICDGRSYLEQGGDRYDVIMLDVVLGTGYSPYRMATVEFYELCQKRLAPDGVLAVSLFQVEPFFQEKMQTLSACFQQVFICKLANGNAVALASNSGNKDALSIGAIQERAELLEQQLGLGFPLVKRSQELELWVSESESPTIFRDATPPASYFDLLPYFNTLFSQVQPHLPCPCGSGKMFQDCHGLELM